MKSFKIIKEASGARKLISYFATWDQVSKCISSSQLWNDVSFSWCHYSTPRFGFQKCHSARIDKAKNLQGSSQATPQMNTKLKFSDNPRFYN
ncbi:hypothetical protein RclHR1_16380009 [Rhizophagus clarus]|nr:hypothetical protein RclHR1_16380009 [Rhizophagus clarus]